MHPQTREGESPTKFYLNLSVRPLPLRHESLFQTEFISLSCFQAEFDYSVLFRDMTCTDSTPLIHKNAVKAYLGT